MNVEIWSDIACPWCYVGKRRFEAALERFEHADEVQVTWRSFELDPGAPAEREGDRRERIAAKYGITVERAREMEANLVSVAAGEGLDMRFDLVRDGNTFDAHRLLHLAAERGVQDDLKERLLHAYFTEGERISDHERLAALAAEAGVPEQEARELLASDRFAAEVRGEEQLASAFGITGVPFFVVDRAIGASGAQDPEVLVEMLRQGWKASHPEISVVAEGDSCGIDGC